MQSRVLRLKVDVAVFFAFPMEAVPTDIDLKAMDEAIQDAIKRSIPGAHATGKSSIDLQVDGRFDIRKMRKIDGGVKYR